MAELTRAGLVLLAVLGAGCGLFTKSEFDAERERLEDNRARWRSSGPASYRYEFQRICFCAPPFSNPATVTVRGDSIVAVTDLRTGAPVDPSRWNLYYTVEGLFTFIEEAMDRPVAELTVGYDSVLGYPTRIYGDAYKDVADDEATFIATNLTAIP